MSWELAFTVVGCVWAIVFWHSIATERQREYERHLNALDAKAVTREKEIEWLKACYRNSVLPEKK